jgi:hypothetical protein
MNKATYKRILEYLSVSEIKTHEEFTPEAISYLRLAVRAILEELKEVSDLLTSEPLRS